MSDSITARLDRIKTEHIENHATNIIILVSEVYPFAIPDDLRERIDGECRRAIRSAVAAADRAITETERERLDAAARRKQEARLALFQRPGRFGHS